MGVHPSHHLLAVDTTPLPRIRPSHAAVVLAYAVPYTALTFGPSHTPTQAQLAEAAALVEPHLDSLAPWEVALLVWVSLCVDSLHAHLL